ncbi:MAG: MlaD family protein [Bryobacterales bacterium]|nr:MlaD family protein [Bryobacteraceae bacterium]MDW8129650.1 MlaD family protein [Bryobacterales bacterium]
MKRIRWAQLRVGLMAIVAMTILAVLIFLMTGQKALFVREAIIYTYMDDSAALATGAPVRLNGILIGNVSRVELSGSLEPNRIVRVTMSVPRQRLNDIPVDSVAAISAENVLGTKYINIKMGTSPQRIRPGGELRSLDVREFEEVVQASYNVIASLNSILKRVDAVVSQIELGRGTIGKFLVDEELYRRVLATVNEAQKAVAQLSTGRGTLGRLLYDEQLHDRLNASLARLDAILEDVQQGQGTAGKLVRDPSLYHDARAAIAEVRRTIEELNAGRGTAGKLLTDDALYRRLDNLVARADDLMARLSTGQGTVGQFLVNPQLYESLNGMTGELRGLIKDIRAEPKKYLRIKLSLF